MTIYRRREIAGLLTESLKTMPVVALTGMRQVGKSTMLLREAGLRGRRYISLDDYAQAEMIRRNPEAILEGDRPLTIDEAQKRPEIFPVIKRLVDKHRRPGWFLLSGSANFLLLKKITESLAGRAVYLTLHPMALREIRGTSRPAPLLLRFFRSPSTVKDAGSVDRLPPDVLLRGGFPAVGLHPDLNADIWFQGYEQTYLERDVRDLAQVPDLAAYRSFFALTALRSGKILNMSELARDARLAHATAVRYMGLLEASFAIRKLPPFLGNQATRLIKAPKVFLADSGLAAYLAGMKNPETHPLYGALMETFVAQNLAALAEAHLPGSRLFFWNIQGRHEVDFILEWKGECLAVEVKTGGRWRDRDLAGLKKFLSLTPACRAGILAYNGTATASLGPRLWAVPIGRLLS